MGFTWGGDFLLSYKLIIECEEDNFSVGLSHFYSLHWWRFNTSKLLKKVIKCSMAQLIGQS